MDRLAEIVREEVQKYAAGNRRGYNLIVFPILDDNERVYAVNFISYPDRETGANVMLMARVVGDKVVIEEDTTNKPLLDALKQRGIPREQIILAYQGEPIPDADQYELNPTR
jgi:sulfur carrier protein ThiS